MVSEARRGRGRHARAEPAEPDVRPRAVLASGRARATIAGVAGTVVMVLVALIAARSGRAPRAAAGTPARWHPVVSAIPAVTPSSTGSGDAAALAYYRRSDARAARHVRSVVWSGRLLRVYTDLPASDADSRTAIGLCDGAAAYLRDTGREPAVFVHAGRRDGYQVLANKTGEGDSCRLGDVP